MDGTYELVASAEVPKKISQFIFISKMFPLDDKNDDGFSLLSRMQPDGTINVQQALHLLSDVEDKYRIDESSLFSCLNV